MTDLSFEELVLKSLVTNEEVIRLAIPHIKSDYFTDRATKAIFEAIDEYFRTRNILPHKNILLTEVVESDHVNDSNLEQTKEVIAKMYDDEKFIQDNKWVLSQIEKWCSERAMYLAIIKSIAVYDGSDKSLSAHAIPELMKEALSVTFQTHIGSDWSDDAEERFNRYDCPENKIPFDLETLNEITFGGVTRKTLSIILAGVHVGKTMSLIHLASGYARLGYNVLYLTLEMGEDEIMQRVDANMLKVSMHKIKLLGKDAFMNRMNFLRQKSYGRIKVVQYPTSMAHVGHFKTLISEYQMKMNWKPDVVIVDYVGIVASSRIKVGMTNSHFYLKSVAEELRAMGIELDVVVWSAMQLTRGGMGSSDVEMTDIAECVSLSTKVLKKNGNEYIPSLITDLQIGNMIKGYKEDVIVKKIFPVKIKQAIRISTKSGKKIVCSMDHKIPTNRGSISYNKGLSVGDQVVVM
jgi:replicative DNA helicase